MRSTLDQISHWNPEVCEKVGHKAGYEGTECQYQLLLSYY